MQGKNVMITGPTEGIGRATALALAERGARLHLLCRNPNKAEALRDELVSKHEEIDVELYLADLGNFDEVRQVARTFVERNEPLDVLINNAGVINTRRILLDNGQEQMFAVNHLGHFLLTSMLLDALKRAEQGRVVVVASEAYRFCRGIRFDDLQWNTGFSAFPTYGHSKLANILFTRELAARLEGTRVTANSLHPGGVRSQLGAQNTWYAGRILALVKPFLRTAEKGAETSVYLATSNDVRTTSGQYFYDCKPKKTKPSARDTDAARRLWTLSERLTAPS
ncbi:MAG: SDR family oxidoreductase [Deltaproteobacteria bacterium]|jgi:NAD(P)-dependent dehydrogenase (short-subunit alcohol dehydrogenase family)|nr:SDR family oxidoreductase [Deltaproteobacteria bacterium]